MGPYFQVMLILQLQVCKQLQIVVTEHCYSTIQGCKFSAHFLNSGKSTKSSLIS